MFLSLAASIWATSHYAGFISIADIGFIIISAADAATPLFRQEIFMPDSSTSRSLMEPLKCFRFKVRDEDFSAAMRFRHAILPFMLSRTLFKGEFTPSIVRHDIIAASLFEVTAATK